jgi:endonuclease I
VRHSVTRRFYTGEALLEESYLCYAFVKVYHNIGFFLTTALLCFVSTAFAQIPAGYYDNAQGLTGEPLRTALFGIIDNHNSQSYNSLWNHFQSTDMKSNGEVWDMYSDVPGGTPAYTYNFGSDQCGNYSGEGDCFNREHSFPKSWFNDQSPMNTDLFHLYPTDGYVNGRRSNYVFADIDNANWTSTNGSVNGPSVFPGYTGTAFEPIDEYKGDFARSYFYMMTRYKTSVASWSSAMLTGDNLSNWARNQMLLWSANDPVSQKEIDRNNVVYGIQNNRNPYIDNPQWITEVWQSDVGIGSEPRSTIELWFAEGLLHIELEEQTDASVKVFDGVGRLLSSWELHELNSTHKIPESHGVFLVVVQSGDQQSVLKVVK